MARPNLTKPPQPPQPPNIHQQLDEIIAMLDGLISKVNVIEDLETSTDAKVTVILRALEPPVAVSIQIVFDAQAPLPGFRKQKYTLLKENQMPLSRPMLPGETLGFTCQALDASGNAAAATLSGLSFTSSDPTGVFTVAPDPANPLRGIVTALTPPVSPDSATLTASGTATEPDGVTTETITGMETITVQTAPPPPPPPPPIAASIGITFDTQPPLPKK